ncbi:MAG: ABC transporter ATP-binding protein, partial [Rhodobacterales bacterium]|nr:ABC transporter ATP-binding protein [Rhodobacterales bacterium]
LLDEPLANLDYKLREELREELPKIFTETGSIFVYATTEPSEALLLGGNTATLCQGRVTQFGPTVAVYRNPVDLITAQTFSDPPLNTVPMTKAGDRFRFSTGETIAVPEELLGIADDTYTVGFHPHHLSPTNATDLTVALNVRVQVTEITGSESFVHLDFAGQRWVMLTRGIHDFRAGETIEVHLNPHRLMVFDRDGRAVSGDRPATA